MNISLVMIARNAEKTIERCLRSVFERESPLAQEAVIVLGGASTDSTREILTRLASEFPIRAFDLPPELTAQAFDVDGHIMDFSIVRNYAHSKASHAWHLWLDSDDVCPTPARVQEVVSTQGHASGGDAAAPGGHGAGEAKGLGDLLEDLPPEINVVWIPYHYLIEPTTDRVLVAQRRERILRWSDGFAWSDPIHEAIVPTGANKYTAQNSAYLTHFWIEHRPDRPDGVREARNFRVLEKMKHLADSRWRVAYYLADHYSASGEFDQARHYFNQAVKLAFNPEEHYITWHNLFRLSWRAGWKDEALLSATRLLSFDAERVEGLADMVLYFSVFEKDPVRCAYWYERFEKSLGKNPEALSMWAAEVKILPHLIAIEAFAALSRHGDAKRACEAALSFEPRHPDAKRWLTLIDRMEAREAAVQNAVKLLDYCESIGAREVALDVIRVLPATIRSMQPIKQVQERILGHLRDEPLLTLTPESELPSWVPAGVPCLRAAAEGGFPVSEWVQKLSGETRIAFDDVWDRLYVPTASLDAFNAKLLIGMAREGLWDTENRRRVETVESAIEVLPTIGDLEYLKLVYPQQDRPTIVAWVNARANDVQVWRNGARVHVYAPASIEDWGPESPDTTGIGASESQIVELVRRLSKRGMQVTVYGSIQVPEVESSVTWRNVKDFDHRDDCDLLIAHRAPWLAHRTDIGARKFYVWLHDQPESFSIAAFFAKTQTRVNRYICLTKTQAGGYASFHHLGVSDPLIPYFLPACDLEPLPSQLCEEHTAVYASAPYRGLEYLLQIWPRVRAAVPDAVLRVAYGWQVFDAIATVEGAAMREKRSAMEAAMKQPGVEWLGRIPQRALREVLDHSRVWAYPLSYPEMLCHVGQRCASRGVWPVIRPYAALAETVLDGDFIHGNPIEEPVQVEFAAAIVKAMTCPASALNERRLALREGALAWHKAAEEGWERALTEDGLW